MLHFEKSLNFMTRKYVFYKMERIIKNLKKMKKLVQ